MPAEEHVVEESIKKATGIHKKSELTITTILSLLLLILLVLAVTQKDLSLRQNSFLKKTEN